MLVAYYARVSTNRQENEETIETQILAIKDFAKENNLDIVKEYKDEGWSGTILVRPALDELRLDAKSKLWDAVVVYDPDRIARKYSYQSLIIDELEEAGVKVLFVTTPPAKTDEDKLLYGVKGLFAEYERARITERFRLGKLRKAREGNIVTTEAAYGYTYIPKQGQKHGYYVVNPQEAEVVKMIFTWIGEQGFTIRKVIKQLQDLHINPRKSKRGVWNNSTLVNLLRNETYIGTAHYLKSFAVVPENPLKHEKYKKVKKTSRKVRPQEEWIPISTPKLINEELFEKTRQQLRRNFELCKRNRKNEYLLSGRIYCTCDNRRAGEGAQKGKHLYYRCEDRVKSYPLPPVCLERGINARIADALVWQEICRFMSSSSRIQEQAEKWIAQKHTKVMTSDKSVEVLEKEMEKLKKEEQRYVKAYGAEIISFEKFQELLGDIKEKEESIRGQLNNLKEQTINANISMPSKEQIKEFTQAVVDKMPTLTFEIRQALVREWVSKIVASQQEMKVYGYVPIGKENSFNYVKFKSLGRNCWASKCREKHPVQCFTQKAAGFGCKLSFCNYRAKCRNCCCAG